MLLNKQQIYQMKITKYDYNEVNILTDINESGVGRIDSYIPNEKIISRKATDLDVISFSDFDRYLKELATKYAPGTEIRSNKYPDIDGTTLQGQMCLEIPATNKDFYDIDKYKKYAKDTYNIEIIFLEEDKIWDFTTN